MAADIIMSKGSIRIGWGWAWGAFRPCCAGEKKTLAGKSGNGESAVEWQLFFRRQACPCREEQQQQLKSNYFSATKKDREIVNSNLYSLSSLQNLQNLLHFQSLPGFRHNYQAVVIDRDDSRPSERINAMATIHKMKTRKWSGCVTHSRIPVGWWYLLAETVQPAGSDIMGWYNYFVKYWTNIRTSQRIHDERFEKIRSFLQIPRPLQCYDW